MPPSSTGSPRASSPPRRRPRPTAASRASGSSRSPCSRGIRISRRLTNRASRKRILEASRARGSRGNDNDNRAVLLEIVRLRAERAALLGYDIHAATSPPTRRRAPPRPSTTCSASSPCPPPATRVREQAALQAIIDAEPEPFPLEAHDWAFYTEKVRAGRVRPRPRRAAPVVRGRAGAAGRRLPRRDGALRHHVHRARRPVGVPPRRARLRGPQRGRLGARPVHPRPLHARHEARRRLDELDRLAVAACAAPTPIVVNNLNVPKPAPGMPDAAHARRGHHALPRVRARPARPVRDGDLPALRRHERVPRLRRVPEPGQRDVDLLAGDPRGLCPPRRHRRAASRRCRREARTRPRPSTRASRRASTSRRPGSTRRGTR